MTASAPGTRRGGRRVDVSVDTQASLRRTPARHAPGDADDRGDVGSAASAETTLVPTLPVAPVTTMRMPWRSPRGAGGKPSGRERGEDVVATVIASSPGSGGVGVGVAAAAGPQHLVLRAVGRRSPSARRRRAEEHDRRGAEGGREVRDAGVAADDPPGVRRRSRRAPSRSVSPASTAPLTARRRGDRRAPASRSAALPVTTTSRPASSSARATAAKRSAGQRRAPLAAPGCTIGRARRAPATARAAARGARSARVGGHAGLASAAGTSARPRARPRATRDAVLAAKAISRRGRGGAQQRGALRPAAVQVDGDVGAARRGRRRAAPCRRPRRPRRVSAASGASAAGAASTWRCVRVGARQRAQRGDAGEEVAEPERAVGRRQAHGQDGSPAGVTSSSRTSTPGGLAEREDDAARDVAPGR